MDLLLVPPQSNPLGSAVPIAPVPSECDPPSICVSPRCWARTETALARLRSRADAGARVAPSTELPEWLREYCLRRLTTPLGRWSPPGEGTICRVQEFDQ